MNTCFICGHHACSHGINEQREYALAKLEEAQHAAESEARAAYASPSDAALARVETATAAYRDASDKYTAFLISSARGRRG
jgi:hypothetical protein